VLSLSLSLATSGNQNMLKLVVPDRGQVGYVGQVGRALPAPAADGDRGVRAGLDPLPLGAGASLLRLIRKYLPKGAEILTSLEYQLTVADSLNLLDPCYISGLAN